MGERGLDISEWQAGMDVERVVRENNISFVMVRTNYGSNHDDALFHSHCDGAERGGAIVTPYSYPLSTDTKGSIDDAVRIIGGRYDRCIVDWEVGSGGGEHLRIAHERVWEHGLTTPVTYDPAWYYQQVGSPNVDWMGQSGRIAGRWKSWYPDNIPGSFDQILAKLPGYVWNDSRGGIATRIVQFTSSGRLSGWGGNVDLNYFPGTRDELADLLGGDDMPLSKDDIKAIANEVWITPLVDAGTNHTENADQWLTAAVAYAAGALGNTQSLLARAVADVDEEELARQLAALGATGATPAQVKQALAEVLRQGTDKESA